MSNAAKLLQKHNQQMDAHFAALYAPDRKRLVFGDGDARSRIVLVGEAPGEQEALAGKPFVGKAGKLLDGFLASTGLNRADIYITNVVKFRPTAISKTGRTVNRTPSAEEIALFTPWLRREMELIAPEYIVTLGNVALKAVSGDRTALIGACHGRLFPGGGMEAHLFPIYHPAAVIYRRALAQTYADDLAAFRRLLSR